MKDYYNEQTILLPHKTSFRTEAFIMDARFIHSANRFGEFSVVIEPLSMMEHQALMEHLESCVSEVRLNTPPNSNKEASASYENGKGFLYSSQLFTPKTNIEFSHPDELYGRTATITGHARDLPLGQVVIQIDYIDIDDLSNGINEEPEIALVADDDDW
tara:strand:- start:37 stop:513 length:477 start_codon:yes stop_codon:yes gene_type:complete